MDKEELERRKEAIRKASAAARGEADLKTDKDLESINQQAVVLSTISKELDLVDRATYDKLIGIVDEATRNNLAIARVVDRVRALGQAGAKLAAGISGLSGPGALAALSSVLKRQGDSFV